MLRSVPTVIPAKAGIQTGLRPDLNDATRTRTPIRK